MIHYIYVLQNTINNKIYIGQTTNPKKRMLDHKARSRAICKNQRNNILYNAIRKHGFENFKMTIIEENVVDEIDDAEKLWISIFNTRNKYYGYNLAEGGKVNRGFKRSEETKNKDSLIKREYYKFNKPWNAGKHSMSEEQKSNLSKMWQGEKSRRAKLTNIEASQIRELFKYNIYSQKELSIIYGVLYKTINDVVNNKIYV